MIMQSQSVEDCVIMSALKCGHCHIDCVPWRRGQGVFENFFCRKVFLLQLCKIWALESTSPKGV